MVNKYLFNVSQDLYCYFNLNRGDYGLPPSQSPFLMNAIVTSHYTSHGAYYPTGGSIGISKAIIPTIERSLGKVFVRAPVSHIILDPTNQRAIGVHVRGLDIYSKCIVSSVGVINTYCKLLGNSSSDLVNKVKAAVKLDAIDGEACPSDQLEPSCSMFSVFVGLNGNVNDLNIPAQNVWLYPYPSWNHDTNMLKYHDSVLKIRKHIADSCNYDSLSNVSSNVEFDANLAADYYFPCVFISSSTG